LAGLVREGKKKGVDKGEKGDYEGELSLMIRL